MDNEIFYNIVVLTGILWENKGLLICFFHIRVDEKHLETLYHVTYSIPLPLVTLDGLPPCQQHHKRGSGRLLPQGLWDEEDIL